jgi:putative transcriptional regulator
VTAEDIRALRRRLGLSQPEFAARYQMSLRTLQNYEQGRDTPPASAMILLTLIDREPETIARILEENANENQR